MNKILPLRIITVLFLFNLISCSTDSNDPIPDEVTVATSDLAITMDENPENGQVIGTVPGSTNEGSVTFSISEQTPSGAFSIDEVSGELKVVDETLFDFEINPVITGIVKVANGDVFKNASITITLNNLEEENIYEGDIWIGRQDSIDYLGTLGYTGISGSLRIGDISSNDIHDLTPLSSIKKIGGNLEIHHLELLPTLDGLENINTIGGDLNIYANPILINIEALSQLTNIPNDLFILGNTQLAVFTGLQNISTVGRDLQLYSFRYKNLIGLSGITTVGRDLTIQDYTIMETIDMNNVTYIGGNLKISSNARLTNLDFCSSISKIIGNIKIRDNERLSDYCGLRTVLNSNNFGGTYSVDNNAYNPTQLDIINGNCAL